MTDATQPYDFQVVIVGGGPVGSLLAYLLAQAGVEAVLLDANPGLVKDYRASTFHPPTLDLLESSGVADALVAMGLQCPVIQYRDRRAGPIGELDLSVLRNDTRHPYRLQCEQFKLTGWLHDRLAEMPEAEIRMDQTVLSVWTDDTGGAVRTSGTDGEQTWRGRYVIGTDGARSTVRTGLEIPFDGYTHPEQFLVAGTDYDFMAAMPDIQFVNYTSDPDEWFLMLRIPDMWRVVVPVPLSVAADEAKSSDYIQGCLHNICPSDEPYEILVNSIYRVHQRVAARYRQASTLLAGDAAHVNNPLGGMGLNGGIHDALYLASCLARVLNGGADDALLDSYEEVRRPVALNDINASTERNKRILEERNPAVRAANNEHLRKVCSDPLLAYQHALDVSMILSLRRISAVPAAAG
jgi:3-(3-hydroxy-phenyl)propionate hydroxylase